jgi:hypothetical protein
MGNPVEFYTDSEGNKVVVGDDVEFEGRDYRVTYISWNYVNLSGSDHLHLSFTRGVPKRKEPNRGKSVMKFTVKPKQPEPREPVALITANGNLLFKPKEEGGASLMLRGDGTTAWGIHSWVTCSAFKSVQLIYPGDSVTIHL